MDDDSGMWLEAAAGLQSEMDAELRADALEVYLAEAARTRLCDRTGAAMITLRSGRVLRGVIARSDPAAVPDGFLALRERAGRLLLVTTDAVVRVVGSHTGLRDEAATGPRLARILREAWANDQGVRALLSDGTWATGAIRFVGADHVEVQVADGVVVVPFSAVEAWDLGGLAS